MGLCVLCTVYVSDLSVSLVCSITYCTLDGLDNKSSLVTCAEGVFINGTTKPD